MPLKLTVPNYFFHLLVAFIVAAFIVGAFAYVVSPGAVPDPGHALSEIQSYFQGDASLQQSLGKFCQSDGTGCPAAGASLPAGVAGQTLRHDGNNWVASSILFNNGTNFGINTTNPQTALDIGTGAVGSPRFQFSQETNSFPRLYMGGSSATVSYVVNKINPATTGYFGEAADTGGYQFRGTGNFNVQGNVGFGITPHGSLEVYGTNANAWVYFNGNANGVPNPSAGVNTGFMTAWNPSGGQGETQILYGTGLGTTPRLDFGRWSGSAKTIDMTLRNGNVGIGTTTPAAKLEVAGQVKITGGSPGLNKVLTSDASGLATWQAPSIGTLSIVIDTATCTTTQVSPNNVGTTLDCGAQNMVMTKVYSKTDNWGASDHHALTITCCKLKIQ